MEASPSPQPCVVGEASQIILENQTEHGSKQSYASLFAGQQTAETNSKLELCPVSFDQGLLIVEFTVDEVNSFTREEGLQQAVIIKFLYGKPELQELGQILPKQLGVKGGCNIGQLEYRHIFVRFDLFEDYAQVVSRTTGYVKAKGDELFFRTFPWTMGFNPREETSKAKVWISFPDLPANLFAKKSLLSIVSVVRKPIAVDKATKDRARPSTTRVKVLINLLDKHPTQIKVKIVDSKFGIVANFDQQIVFDNVHAYCTNCNHQGHNVKSCRWISEYGAAVHIGESDGRCRMSKLEGDARDYLNANFAGRRTERMLPNVIQDIRQLNDSGSGVQTVKAVSTPNGDGVQIFKRQNTVPLHTPLKGLSENQTGKGMLYG